MNDSTAVNDSRGLLLPGLDATNPLGFLAAMGLFRIVTCLTPQQAPRMSWEPTVGTWVARLWDFTDQEEELLRWLDGQLTKEYEHHPFDQLSTLGVEEWAQRRSLIANVAELASLGDCTFAYWVSAMTSDAVSSNETTQLQTARRDYFRGNVQSVISATSREHLARTLFRTWDYADALHNQSLHFDPGEDRRHAHQWNRPSGDPDRGKFGGMLGANRLALEALPAFLSVPKVDRLQTLGFSGTRSNDTRWTWAIWTTPVEFEVAKSLLALPELQETTIGTQNRRSLQARGIAAAFRSRRILVGKTPNFTPPQRVA